MNTEKNKVTDDILESLNGIKRASAPDFFYTRLKARMEKGMGAGNSSPYLLRPAYAFITIVVVLLLNAAILFKNNSSNDIESTEKETLQSIAAEYNLNDNISIYDLTQDN